MRVVSKRGVVLWNFYPNRYGRLFHGRICPNSSAHDTTILCWTRLNKTFPWLPRPDIMEHIQ